jgi:uncharacterized membrane protein
MVTTNTQAYNDPGAGGSMQPASRKTTRSNGSNGKLDDKLASALGWFSIGIGLAELVKPGAVNSLIGVKNDGKTRGVQRGYGVRELAAGIGILMQPRPTPWVWGRVAGDVLDLSSLASAFGSHRNNKGRLVAATAAVVGVTALDVICAQRLSTEERQNGPDKSSTTATKAIAVDTSPEKAYSYWRDFENLPRFVTYLQSVRTTGDRRSHWIAKGPKGVKFEWDTEVVRDEPNRLIEWKTVDGKFAHTGSVRFDPAPGGRGTIVRVEMDFAPNGGVLNSALGKIPGKILGKGIGQRIQHDLRNFKQILEVGEVTESDASIYPGMHAAQPPAQPPAQQPA